MRGCSKVLSHIYFLDLLHTPHLCMVLTCAEIKTGIFISFLSFIKCDRMLLQ